ncbi:amino acid adenylation domain-containing protein [Buttiauxella warmboldiae]|uniref:Amino acid adenylation domain-containing protein n=1 Tax=Buttiauxella warmboldiae TaxID=82993 RepID=A0A3N5DAA7_9ENTR|nr:non-ribosomal peptide synthetase [Buttiauxella warmboldiae]RPH24121.1 amino acid adenylation domain-containing protein [Buttiauxella warmboldiae]
MSESDCTSGQTRYRTTKIQRAYFVGRQLALPLGGVECVACLAFTGKGLDETKLRLAINNIANLPALRWRFLDADYLIQGEKRVPELTIHHRHRSQASEHESVLRERMFSQSIDLTQGLLWGVELTHWHDGRSTLHIAISLAVVDLAGLSALMHHFMQFYQQRTLPPQCVNPEQLYQRLHENQLRIARKRQKNQQRLEKLAFARMEDLPPPPDLPFTSFRPEQQSLTGSVLRRSRVYDARQWGRVREYAAKLDVAPSALVLALYTRALRQYSAIPDFVVTVTNLSVTGTEMELTERTVAYAHRARRLESLEAMVRDTHDDLRYRLLRGVDCETELRSVLADASCTHPGVSPYIFTYAAQQPVFDNQVIDTFGQPRMWGQTPQVVIDCQVFMLTEHEIEVAFDVRRAAIPADVEKGIFALLTESIDAVIAGRQPDDVLPRAARAWRTAVNSTPAASPPEMLFSGFRRQVQVRPQALALVSPANDPDLPPELCDPLLRHQQMRQWCYAELDQLALRLAARLVTHTIPEEIIGIRLPKGPSQIVAALAVLYAGCAYLPVGMDMPEERLSKISQRSGMRYLLTAVDFEQIEQQMPLTEPRAVAGGDNPEALAYVIFTSGSTGEPKGVAIAHRAANNTIADVNIRHQVTERDVLLAVSSLDFDLSVYDIFGPLSAGAKIVTINENERRDAFRWAERIKVYQVTLWNSVPALAAMLSAAADRLPSVRAWLCSGDWIAPSLFSELQKVAPSSVLVAMGGSTEAAIWSNEYVIRSAEDLKARWSSVPYGLPLSGQQYRVVREEDVGRFEDCPDGVTGELWIGGEGLAQGYLGDPERTAERFVYARETAAGGETRWYRTGDLGYWREGLLFFVGRLDTQVKIQGHRVECGEIEQALKNLPGIDNAVVVPIRQRRALGAVLVGRDILTEQLPPLLSRQLPHYMIPARFLMRDRLVLSRNGKIDRAWANQELESEETVAPCDTELAPSSLFTCCLAAWRQVLGRDEIGADDNFFALGGDSLAATRVCVLLQSQGVQVDVGELFAASTLNDFALCCQTGAVRRAVDGSIRSDLLDPFPLTSLQRAYALGADGIPGVSRCDTVFSIILHNEHGYPLVRWQQALDALIRETAALRLVRTEAQQQIVTPQPVPLAILPEGENLQAYLSDAPLDARAHPSVRLVAIEDDPTRVGVMFNYLSLDALSLIRIILALIERVTGQQDTSQPESHITPFLLYASQIAGQAVSSSEWDAETWQPPVLSAISGMPAVSRIKSLTWHLSDTARQMLEEQAQREQVTLSALILKALGESLIILCDRQQVVIVVPICWRPSGSLQALGQFTQLRLCRYTANSTVREVSHSLGEAVAGRTPDDRYIAARGRAVYPFVFTSTVGIPEVETLNQRETRIDWSHTRTPGVLIDCQVLPRGNGLEIRWDYAAGILDQSQLMVAHRLFVSQLLQERGGGEIAAEPDFSPAPPIAGFNGDQIGRRAISAALRAIDKVPAALIPVIDVWKKLDLPAADPAWSEVGHFLASCISGERPRNDLLQHPFLAPEQLLLASLRQIAFFDCLIADLRAQSLRLHPARSALSVLILGAGSGVFGQALVEAAAERGLPLRLDEYEGSEVLNAFAAHRKPTEGKIPDVVIAPASLHRDGTLLGWLTDIHRMEHQVAPTHIHVLEVTEPDAASLIAALLNPALVDNGQSPLLAPSAWGRCLEQIGASLEQVLHPTENLVWIKATLLLAQIPQAWPQPFVPNPAPVEVEAQVAACWKKVLGLSSPPASSADFFALGGDSLGATQIVMALRQQGIGSVRLADLFNHPKFADFVAWILAQSPYAQKPPLALSEQLTTYPLTLLQKAYLAGRSPDQLLGGVASHCYFEFSVSEPEGIDIAIWQQALSQVIARHDALRSRIVWQNGEPFGLVSEQAVCPPEVTADVRALTEAEIPDPVQHYPLRVRLSPDGKTIGIGMDNLMLDGISMFLVMRELGAIYQGKTLPPPAVTTYAQYRRSCRETVPVAVKRMPPAPCLPWLNPLAAVNDMHFARSAHHLEASLWQTMRQWASRHRVTPTALLLAAYALEIAELALEPEFSLNVTTFERDPDVPDAASLVGDFTQLGLVAFAPEPGGSGSGQRRQRLLEQAQVAHQGLLTIHDRPEQVSTLRIAREIVRQQGEPMAGLFPVVFTSGLGFATDIHRSDDFGFGTLTYARSQTPQVAMDFQVHDDIRGLHITVDYVTELLAAERVDTLTAGVAERLRELVAVTEPIECEITALSTTIARIWRQHLPEAEGATLDNFFQSGGDSLQATRCIRTLQAEIDPGISLRLLLIYPRFSEFCEQVAQLLAKSASEQAVAATSMKDFEEGML